MVLNTGKSSLTVQFVEGHFVESYYPTIENTFSRAIRCNGQDYATEIVDTAGQVSHVFSAFFTHAAKPLHGDRLNNRRLSPETWA